MSPRVLGIAAALVWVTQTWAMATPDGARLAPYLRALDARSVGTVEARAYSDPKRPSQAPAPLEGVSLLLVPFDSDVDAKLDAIKARQRQSIETYVKAYADLKALCAAYERDVSEGGGGSLVRTGVSDASGVVRMESLPEGEWLLVGWREERHAVKGAKTPSKDAVAFPDVDIVSGYAAISYWRMRVSVRAGEVTSVDLSDRGVWMTAVRQDVTHPVPSAKKPTTPARRR